MMRASAKFLKNQTVTINEEKNSFSELLARYVQDGFWDFLRFNKKKRKRQTSILLEKFNALLEKFNEFNELNREQKLLEQKLLEQKLLKRKLSSMIISLNDKLLKTGTSEQESSEITSLNEKLLEIALKIRIEIALKIRTLEQESSKTLLKLINIIEVEDYRHTLASIEQYVNDQRHVLATPSTRRFKKELGNWLYQENQAMCQFEKDIAERAFVKIKEYRHNKNSLKQDEVEPLLSFVLKKGQFTSYVLAEDDLKNALKFTQQKIDLLKKPWLGLFRPKAVKQYQQTQTFLTMTKNRLEEAIDNKTTFTITSGSKLQNNTEKKSSKISTNNRPIEWLTNLLSRLFQQKKQDDPRQAFFNEYIQYREKNGLLPLITRYYFPDVDKTKEEQLKAWQEELEENTQYQSLKSDHKSYNLYLDNQRKKPISLYQFIIEQLQGGNLPEDKKSYYKETQKLMDNDYINKREKFFSVFANIYNEFCEQQEIPIFYIKDYENKIKLYQQLDKNFFIWYKKKKESYAEGDIKNALHFDPFFQGFIQDVQREFENLGCFLSERLSENIYEEFTDLVKNQQINDHNIERILNHIHLIQYFIEHTKENCIIPDIDHSTYQEKKGTFLDGLKLVAKIIQGEDLSEHLTEDHQFSPKSQCSLSLILNPGEKKVSSLNHLSFQRFSEYHLDQRIINPQDTEREIDPSLFHIVLIALKDTQEINKYQEKAHHALQYLQTLLFIKGQEQSLVPRFQGNQLIKINGNEKFSYNNPFSSYDMKTILIMVSHLHLDQTHYQNLREKIDDYLTELKNQADNIPLSVLRDYAEIYTAIFTKEELKKVSAILFNKIFDPENEQLEVCEKIQNFIKKNKQDIEEELNQAINNYLQTTSNEDIAKQFSEKKTTLNNLQKAKKVASYFNLPCLVKIDSMIVKTIIKENNVDQANKYTPESNNAFKESLLESLYPQENQEKDTTQRFYYNEAIGVLIDQHGDQSLKQTCQLAQMARAFSQNTNQTVVDNDCNALSNKIVIKPAEEKDKQALSEICQGYIHYLLTNLNSIGALGVFQTKRFQLAQKLFDQEILTKTISDQFKNIELKNDEKITQKSYYDVWNRLVTHFQELHKRQNGIQEIKQHLDTADYFQAKDKYVEIKDNSHQALINDSIKEHIKQQIADQKLLETLLRTIKQEAIEIQNSKKITDIRSSVKNLIQYNNQLPPIASPKLKSILSSFVARENNHQENLKKISDLQELYRMELSDEEQKIIHEYHDLGTNESLSHYRMELSDEEQKIIHEYHDLGTNESLSHFQEEAKNLASLMITKAQDDLYQAIINRLPHPTDLQINWETKTIDNILQFIKNKENGQTSEKEIALFIIKKLKSQIEDDHHHDLHSLIKDKPDDEKIFEYQNIQRNHISTIVNNGLNKLALEINKEKESPILQTLSQENTIEILGKAIGLSIQETELLKKGGEKLKKNSLKNFNDLKKHINQAITNHYQSKLNDIKNKINQASSNDSIVTYLEEADQEQEKLRTKAIAHKLLEISENSDREKQILQIKEDFVPCLTDEILQKEIHDIIIQKDKMNQSYDQFLKVISQKNADVNQDLSDFTTDQLALLRKGLNQERLNQVIEAINTRIEKESSNDHNHIPYIVYLEAIKNYLQNRNENVEDLNNKQKEYLTYVNHLKTLNREIDHIIQKDSIAFNLSEEGINALKSILDQLSQQDKNSILEKFSKSQEGEYQDIITLLKNALENREIDSQKKRAIMERFFHFCSIQKNLTKIVENSDVVDGTEDTHSLNSSIEVFLKEPLDQETEPCVQAMREEIRLKIQLLIDRLKPVEIEEAIDEVNEITEITEQASNQLIVNRLIQDQGLATSQQKSQIQEIEFKKLLSKIDREWLLSNQEDKYQKIEQKLNSSNNPEELKKYLKNKIEEIKKGLTNDDIESYVIFLDSLIKIGGLESQKEEYYLLSKLVKYRNIAKENGSFYGLYELQKEIEDLLKKGDSNELYQNIFEESNNKLIDIFFEKNPYKKTKNQLQNNELKSQILEIAQETNVEKLTSSMLNLNNSEIKEMARLNCPKIINTLLHFYLYHQLKEILPKENKENASKDSPNNDHNRALFDNAVKKFVENYIKALNNDNIDPLTLKISFSDSYADQVISLLASPTDQEEVAKVKTVKKEKYQKALYSFVEVLIKSLDVNDISNIPAFELFSEQDKKDLYEIIKNTGTFPESFIGMIADLCKVIEEAKENKTLSKPLELKVSKQEAFYLKSFLKNNNRRDLSQKLILPFEDMIKYFSCINIEPGQIEDCAAVFKEKEPFKSKLGNEQFSDSSEFKKRLKGILEEKLKENKEQERKKREQFNFPKKPSMFSESNDPFTPTTSQSDDQEHAYMCFQAS